MRGVSAAVLCLCLMGKAGAAEEVTFTLPPEFAELPVSWSATPLDLPADADMFEAMVMQPDADAGPWVVDLDPGPYVISAFSAAEVFESEITVIAGSAQAYEVAPIALTTAIPFRCVDAETCAFKDEATGLSFTLPKGWAAEAPYYFDPGDGTVSEALSAVFFEDIEGDGADVWFLNPPEWGEHDGGPCADLSLGALCTFDLSAKAQAAFDVIAPSLALSSAP